MGVRLPEWLRKEVKSIVVEALREWENDVEYRVESEMRKWEPDDKKED